MLEIIKSGITQYGVWIYGTLKSGDFEINGIFKTNLKEIPSEKSLKVKKFKISTGKNGLVRYYVEF